MDSYKFWKFKRERLNEMLDLTFSRPDDIFVFTRFTEKAPSALEGKQIIFAESIEEAAEYFHHIFLYDILYDAVGDIQTDFKAPFDENQERSISLLSFWYKAGKLPFSNACEKGLFELCDKFNCEYSNCDTIEYEIKILKGINELKEFLNDRFSQDENFDKATLDKICNEDVFAGRLLRDFIKNLFIF